MDQFSSRIKQLTTELKEYFEIKLNLAVLNIGEQLAKLIGESVQKLFGYIIIGVGSFFGLIALAIYLGEVLDNEAIGYAIIAIPLLVIGLFLILTKGIANGIKNKFMNEILKTLEDDKSEVLKLPEPKGQEKDEKVS